MMEWKNKKGDKILKIEQDECPESPREWDNFGTMVCFHNNYTLGDKHDLNEVYEDGMVGFGNWDGMKKYLIKEKKAVVVLPIYLYDHSGLTIKTTPFGCNWDSGQIGFIYCTKETMKENGVTKKLAKEYLDSEVQIYNQYIQGEVYCVSVSEVKKCKCCNHVENEILDSIGSIFGDEGRGLFELAKSHSVDLGHKEKWIEV